MDMALCEDNRLTKDALVSPITASVKLLSVSEYPMRRDSYLLKIIE
jgi:hypothetical protein